MTIINFCDVKVVARNNKKFASEQVFSGKNNFFTLPAQPKPSDVYPSNGPISSVGKLFFHLRCVHEPLSCDVETTRALQTVGFGCYCCSICCSV